MSRERGPRRSPGTCEVPHLLAWACLGLILAACQSSGQANAVAASTPGPAASQTPPPTAKASQTPAPTATSTPANTPTNTPTSTPTSTPAPVLRQLTSGGCCVQPFWSPDGAQVLFIDRPDPAQPAGIWGVGVEGGPPQLVIPSVDLFSPDLRLRAFLESGKTIVERLESGDRWVAQAEGRAISFSPDSRRIAWQVALSSTNFDRRMVEVWVADVDGSEARRVARLSGGGLSGWFPDGERLLVSGRDPETGESVLSALGLADGGLTAIARGPRLRNTLLSPAGGWAAYQVSFSGDPAQDGLWIAGAGRTLRLDVFGAYRWRSEGRLLVIPLEMGAASHRLLEVDAASGAVRPLTDPVLLPFRVAAGDWAASPDGRRVVFVSAEDHNLWLIDLPPE